VAVLSRHLFMEAPDIVPAGPIFRYGPGQMGRVDVDQIVEGAVELLEHRRIVEAQGKEGGLVPQPCAYPLPGRVLHRLISVAYVLESLLYLLPQRHPVAAVKLFPEFLVVHQPCRQGYRFLEGHVIGGAPIYLPHGHGKRLEPHGAAGARPLDRHTLKHARTVEARLLQFRLLVCLAALRGHDVLAPIDAAFRPRHLVAVYFQKLLGDHISGLLDNRHGKVGIFHLRRRHGGDDLFEPLRSEPVDLIGVVADRIVPQTEASLLGGPAPVGVLVAAI